MVEWPIVDPLTHERFACFSADDRQFLSAFCAKHPAVAQNFYKFIGLPPALRPNFAKTMLWNLPRTGWVRRGVENPENVLDHSFSLADVIENFLSGHPELPTDEPAATKSAIQKLIDMAKAHDFTEAIATDFTPGDKVPEADKNRVEQLAANVIFAAPEFAKGLALVTEYINQETDASHILHDFDKIHPVMITYCIEKDQNREGLCKEFYDYALPRMKTEVGRNYLTNFYANKESIPMPAPKSGFDVGNK